MGKVDNISSVSGGSIFAAHLIQHWDRYKGTSENFDDARSELFRLARSDIRGRVIRRYLLAVTFPPLWLVFERMRPTKLLEREYAKFYKDYKIFDLFNNIDSKKPDLHILSTSFTTGDLCSFTKSGFLIRDTKSIREFPTRIIPIALAVAASSAYPPLVSAGLTDARTARFCLRGRIPLRRRKTY